MLIEMKKNESYFKYSEFSSLEKEIYYNQIFLFIRRLMLEYPRFDKWYKNLFYENRSIKKDREIIICEKEGCIVGIAILKSDKKEKKICTLRVAKKFQKQGIGRKLMEMSFEWLQDEKPLITMHSRKQRQFSSLLEYYGFKLEEKKYNYYNIFSTELIYNGTLPEKKILLNQLENIDMEVWINKFISYGKCNWDEFLDQCIFQLYQYEKNKTGNMLNF